MQLSTANYQSSSAGHPGLAGIDTQRLKAMRNAALRDCFSRLEESRYRMETVARVRGREYINDAAARTVGATWYALESLQGGLVWIADAPRAEADYSRLVPPAMRKVRMLLILGGDSECMRKAFSGVVPVIEACPSMADALQRAYRYEADDVKVLYSPACDNGRPIDEDGNDFCHEVNEL